MVFFWMLMGFMVDYGRQWMIKVVAFKCWFSSAVK